MFLFEQKFYYKTCAQMNETFQKSYFFLNILLFLHSVNLSLNGDFNDKQILVKVCILLLV